MEISECRLDCLFIRVLEHILVFSAQWKGLFTGTGGISILLTVYRRGTFAHYLINSRHLHAHTGTPHHCTLNSIDQKDPKPVQDKLSIMMDDASGITTPLS
jgi:hypothetical protein